MSSEHDVTPLVLLGFDEFIRGFLIECGPVAYILLADEPEWYTCRGQPVGVIVHVHAVEKKGGSERIMKTWPLSASGHDLSFTGEKCPRTGRKLDGYHPGVLVQYRRDTDEREVGAIRFVYGQIVNGLRTLDVSAGEGGRK